MKKLGYIALLLLLVSFSALPIIINDKTVRISQQSTLEISGTTNVRDFACMFNIKNVNRPISVRYQEKNKSIYFENSTLILENAFFDCGGKGINRDFHDLLKSKEHPEIHLSLKEIKKNNSKENKVDAIVEIKIAGISQLYTMQANVWQEKGFHISGNLQLNISDFGLEAPKKMLGLIVVSEEIEIDFKLVVKEI